MGNDAFYNDNDPGAVAWLRELAARGLISAGTIDARSILDITPEELAGRRRVHLFAGIGGWDYALGLAGWPDDREVWTASCPCQPFSDAGARRGVRDERNLWPAVFGLVAERRPATVFGEQVASRAGREWLARVRADLEGIGYAFGAADLCAASVGAPHIRQRLFWVADAECGDVRGPGHGEAAGATGGVQGADWEWERLRSHAGATGVPERLADAEPVRAWSGEPREQGHAGLGRDRPSECGETGGLWLSIRTLGLPEPASLVGGVGIDLAERGPQGRTPDRRDSPWSEFIIVPCGDGKARRLEPGISPLVARLPRGLVPSGDPSEQDAQASGEARVMRLRGYGNSIVPSVAAEFVRAFLSVARKEA